MIARATETKSPHLSTNWQQQFTDMIPSIRRYALRAFRYLHEEARQDAVAEVIANCCVAYRRLVTRGKAHVASPRVLARYAVARFHDGRRIGKSLNSGDVYSSKAQRKAGFHLQYLGSPGEQRGGWKEQLVENTRTAIPDQVQFRIDFDEWLQQLSGRDRQVAEVLAYGERATQAARMFGLSDARISQLRSKWSTSWEEFQGLEPRVGNCEAAAG